MLQGSSHWLQQEAAHRVNESIAEFVETESSNLYMDDIVIQHPHDESDTLDEIEDDILDDDEDVLWTGDEDDDYDDDVEDEEYEYDEDTIRAPLCESTSPRSPIKGLESNTELYELVSCVDDKQELLDNQTVISQDHQLVTYEMELMGKRTDISTPKDVVEHLPSHNLDTDEEYPVEGSW